MPNGTNTRPHPTIPVTYNNEQVEIDEALAPLITEIWKAGIGTWMSCQETEIGIAWIEFDSVDDLSKFVNIVISYDVHPDSPYNRIEWNSNHLGAALPDWEFRFNLMDITDPDSTRIVGGKVDFVPAVGAYFPHEDIDMMVAKLREYNACNSISAATPVEG